MKVALYVRVSTEEQAEEGFSIEAQIRVLTEYCKSQGHEVVKIYKDEGFSGKSLERPAISELMREIKSRLFNIVMVWDISRLSRRLSDSLKFIEELSENNISFYSYNEKNWATTPTDKLNFQILGAVAEFQRNQITTRVKLGMKQRAKEGKWNGGIVLGYKSENKRLVVVDSEAQIIKHIFNLYINGKGFKAIANQLNHEGYRTKKNKGFSINSVRTIITNPLYAGYVRFNKLENWEEKRRAGTNPNPIMEKGEHEPIIDMHTWNKAQQILESKSKKPAKTFTGHFPLTTLLRCPECGQGMIGHKIKRSKKSNEYIRYYQCGNFHYKGSAICKSNMVRADYAEEFVFKKLEQIASNPTLLRAIVDRVNGKVGTLKEPLEHQLKYTEEQIIIVRKNIDKYLDLFEKGNMASEIILDKINSLETELKTLERRKTDLQFEMSKPIVQEVSYEQLSILLSDFSTIFSKVEPKKQKDLLHSLISKITINPSRKIQERSIKDIELVFDASLKDDYVLTYGTVPRD